MELKSYRADMSEIPIPPHLQLYLNEHGLTPDGRIVDGSPSGSDDGFSTFFSETGSGKVSSGKDLTPSGICF